MSNLLKDITVEEAEYAYLEKGVCCTLTNGEVKCEIECEDYCEE